MKRMMPTDQAAIPIHGNIASDTSVLATSTVRLRMVSSKRNWSEHIKSLLSKLSKALEGDHEFHKYLGG